ncbi:MAG: response regulator [Pirellulaceae bacterium]|nr:response regulator [Pirellulaceae bacterium]
MKLLNNIQSDKMAEREFRLQLGVEDPACGELAARADRENLLTLSMVVNRAGNPIVILGKDGRIGWCNESFERLTGHQQNVNGKTFDGLLFGPSTTASVRQEYSCAISSGGEATFDAMLYRNDGRTLWAETKMVPVCDDSGELSRWIVLLTDISKRRQTEEALESARQSAEANSRSKSEFLANMSHEIRTPLNAILGMTELALATELTREQRDYLKTVKTSADSLLDLLNDVLDISKIEAGRMEIEEIDFNLAEVVRETLKALAVRAHERGLELAVHMPMSIPHGLRGDPTRIRQVLFNLVGNAIKFTEQGEVIVDIEQQWQTDDEVGLQFSVTDTGIGIPKDRLKKIFESFTQVDASMARRFGGTGLGLTITAELVRLMDGKLWVKSQLGKGSTFFFTLTLKLGDNSTPPVTKLEQIELDGLKALIVDDNATNRQILDEMMSHWGMKTTLSNGASTALRELETAARENRPFDLILLDAMMPVVDGFQLAELIRERPELQPGTVMMLSSADRPNSTAKCRELGIVSYLVKPISASALLEAILSTLDRERLSERNRRLPDLSRAQNGLLAARSQTSLQILLVDDHEPNRRLVESILRKRGHVVQSEEDGDAAIRVCKEKPFDVVLMDVQMPGRNGFSATRAIREHEKSTGSHVPIVALTAHALKGDREKCLDAGMDGYLAKPIHADQLIELVESIAATGPARPSRVSAIVDEATTPEFSFEAALARMGGEADLLQDHIRFVLSDIPQLIASMKSAIQDNDSKQIELNAHKLRSMVSSYDHNAAEDLCQSIESDALNGNLNETLTRVERLEELLQTFTVAIENYLQRISSATN